MEESKKMMTLEQFEVHNDSLWLERDCTEQI